MAVFTKSDSRKIPYVGLNPKLQHVQKPIWIRSFESLIAFTRNVVDFMKFLYFMIIVAMVIGVLFEIKCIYHIDVFPNLDTPLDTYFYAAKGSMPSELQ